MAWRDELLTASLDGVPFFYEDVTTEIGRRGEIHEFVNRDDPFAEDLGRAARSWTITAYVLGDDYMLGRDLLMEIIEAGGEHVFRHPYQGDKIVKIIGKVPVKESTKEGGYASFGLTMHESGQEFPLLILPTPPRVKFLADAALLNLSVRTKFNILAAIAAVIRSVTDAINSATSVLRKINGKIGAALGLVDNLTGAINGFLDELGDLLNTPQALMNTLTNLVDALLDAIDTFTPDSPVPGIHEEVVDTVALTRAAIDELFSFETVASAIPTPTPQNFIEQTAHSEIGRAMRGAALASGSKVLAGLGLTSSTQALEIADDLAAKFEAFLRDDIDEKTQESFAHLKAETIIHFVETARSLPDIADYVPPSTVHALVLAYDLYGDPDRAEELIARNKIRHPTFVLGGRPLEVISGG